MLFPLLLSVQLHTCWSTQTSGYRLMSRVADPWQNNQHLQDMGLLTRVGCAAGCDRDPFCLSFYHSRTASTCLLNTFVIHELEVAYYYTGNGSFLYFERTLERWPRRCADIKTADPLAPDADYWLYPSADRVYRNRVKLYCKMSELVPREYLTLIHTNRGRHPPLRNVNCLGETSFFTGQEGDILFSKIRLDPDTMLVDNEDLTYATWTGLPIPYGEAGDCYTAQAATVTPSCGPVGYFRMVVSDTGMQFEYAFWAYNKATTYMQTVPNTMSNVTVYCGGYCGYCDIKPPGIQLTLDRHQLINPASAIFLQ